MFGHPLESAFERVLWQFAKEYGVSWRVPRRDLAHIVLHYAEELDAPDEQDDHPPNPLKGE